MLLEVPRDESLDRNSVVAVEVAAGDEMIGHRPGLVAGPGLEGGDELALVDQAVLQREQAEEEIAVGAGHVRDPAQSRERVGALSHRPVA